MRIDARNLSGSLRSVIQNWGWELGDDTGSPGVMLSEVDGKVEIRVGLTRDVVFLPLNKEEVEYRVESAHTLNARLMNRLHDLRSPLNAIQGYAEMLLESTEGDANRFASNICTASQILTNRLEALSSEGV